MNSLILSVLVAASFNAGATFHAEEKCHDPLATTGGPSREKLVAAILRGNTEGPQRDDFVYLKVLAQYLIEPVSSVHITPPITPAEFEETEEKMNRAHAAYSVDAHVELDPQQKLRVRSGELKRPTGTKITIERVRGLVYGPFFALPLMLEVLAQDIEGIPVKQRRDHFNVPILVYDKLRASEKRDLWSYNDDFFVHAKNEARRRRLTEWGRRLQALLQSPRIRETTAEHRRYVIAQYRANGDDWSELRSEAEYQGNLGKRVFEASLEEFGHSPNDRPFMTFVQSLLAIYHACPMPERSFTSS